MDFMSDNNGILTKGIQRQDPNSMNNGFQTLAPSEDLSLLSAEVGIIQ